MMLTSIDVVWFSMFFYKFISSFGTIPGIGWVGEIGNKANSAKAEAEGDIVFWGKIYEIFRVVLGIFI